MKLILEIKCKSFPIASQMLGVSIIKHALSRQSNEYMESMYKYTDGRSNKNTKNFCFAIRAFDYEINGDEFDIKNKVVMVISSPDQEFIIRTYNGLVSNREIKYKHYDLKIQKIYAKMHSPIKREAAVFKTISPIFIKGKDKREIAVDDPNFIEELNYISEKVLVNYRGYGLFEKLEFQPIDMKKKVVKLDIKGFEDKNRILSVDAYEGIFKLKGNSQDLTELNQLGLGFRRGQGFGAIELL
ncbi:MAG: CRISPR-associated endoribonuclease Cas6 [Proteocatella sp.]